MAVRAPFHASDSASALLAVHHPLALHPSTAVLAQQLGSGACDHHCHSPVPTIRRSFLLLPTRLLPLSPHTRPCHLITMADDMELRRRPVATEGDLQREEPLGTFQRKPKA